MKSLQDTPKHPKLKENMAKLHTNFKEDLCNDILEEIINDLLDIFAFKVLIIANIL